MRIATTFAEVDSVCDYIPFLSTVSNILDLFQKCVYKCLPENIAKNRYWTHIKRKEIPRCLILFVPILGNIYIAISDYFNYQKDKASCNKTIQSHQEDVKSQAHMLALLARQAGGREWRAEEMMPAATKNQQQLWAACFGNDDEPLRALLARGISPNFYHFWSTPLVTACQYSTPEIVRLLVQGGAKVNTSDHMGNSPFAVACTKGNLEMVQILRSYILDINAPNAKGITPLMFAATSGNQELVQFLIEEGANRNTASQDSTDAVSCAIFLKDHAHLLPLLFSQEENVDARSYFIQIGLSSRIQNLTPLLYATLVGAENSALYLVERSNVQLVDSTYSNALYYASKHLPLLQALLNKCHTAEFVNQQNIAGSTALHHAIELDNPDAALLLLKNGADPFIPDKEEKIPLLLACEKGFTTVVEYIQHSYKNRITAEIDKQLAAATEAAISRGDQAQQEGGNPLSSGFDLLQTALEMIRSHAEGVVRDAQEVEELGPIPRSGMEMIFGTLPSPA